MRLSTIIHAGASTPLPFLAPCWGERPDNQVIRETTRYLFETEPQDLLFSYTWHFLKHKGFSWQPSLPLALLPSAFLTWRLFPRLAMNPLLFLYCLPRRVEVVLSSFVKVFLLINRETRSGLHTQRASVFSL